jgi:hypothetical protein
MRTIVRVLSATIIVWGLGCQNPGPLLDPAPLQPLGAQADDQNPVFLPLGPLSYGKVFETVIQILSDYGFEIANGDTNRYSGRIETLPRISPGLALLLKPGSPTLYDRLLSTMQTYRHRVSVVIMPAQQGGYFVEFIARKELEDLPRPVRSTIGGAIFRSDNTVDRQYEVVDGAFFDANWIFRRRDIPLEQELIRRLKRAPFGEEK